MRRAEDVNLASAPQNPDVTATRLRLQAAVDMHTALRLADDDDLAPARGLITDMLEQVSASRNLSFFVFFNRDPDSYIYTGT